ncbi:ATP-binding protein [Gordonia desulfuricans]|uniref:ATP-binding protein n=1 Tax=Gordonia desulfuricans TaxID=89051 RepID=A0A7K3LV56_9ACTN|nr:ATP-binding protein [Gordonia desulfuricans]NDK92163.1 ATP-binding protein [Gordonia desulfuricans]
MGDVNDDRDPVAPLWRAAQIFRLVSFVYALGFLIAIDADLTRPGLTWALFGLLTAANVWWATGYLVGFGRRWWFVAIELSVFVVMMLSTSYVADDAWVTGNQTWPTTLFCANGMLSAALLGGPWWGVAGGLVIGLTNFYVKGELMLNFGRNATILLIVAAGLAVGMAATRARVSAEKLTAAVRVAAAAAERERLAREVHDGVLQVLALITRRGREIGGPSAELADLAAEQERRLRRLIADSPAIPATDTALPAPTADVDLTAALRGLVTESVSVSAPPDPVPLAASSVAQIVAAVRNILDNADRHAGAGTRVFMLLEDLDDEIVLSVRDDGVGIPDGRLDAAVAEGRMGISRSIVGRIEQLGGTAHLETAPGAGTEWELTIPIATQTTPTRTNSPRTNKDGAP